jgi:acyl-CoA dehydrogenase
VIDGHKWFTTAAEGAAFAIVMAVTNPDDPKPHRRASQIIVPLDDARLRARAQHPDHGRAGRGWLSHAEVRFDGCRVPVPTGIGGEGEGFALAQERLGPGRIHHCMRWIGICERAFDLMCRYAVTRELAPGQPLASSRWCSIGSPRAAPRSTRRGCWCSTPRTEDRRGGRAAARVEISLIKFYVAGVLQRVLDRAIQVHGGLGVTDDTLLSFWRIFWWRHDARRAHL